MAVELLRWKDLDLLQPGCEHPNFNMQSGPFNRLHQHQGLVYFCNNHVDFNGLYEYSGTCTVKTNNGYTFLAKSRNSPETEINKNI